MVKEVPYNNGIYGAPITLGSGFLQPFNVAVDNKGNVYVADAGNNLIRKITPAGVVTTFAGSGSYGSVNGTGTAASFSAPRSLAIDNLGNIYVADQGSNNIRQITPAGVVTTFAGSSSAGNTDATGTAASFNTPTGLAVDVLNNVYVADYGNNLIRKITPGGVVTTFAGNGVVGSTNATGTAASFHSPRNLATDGAGNIYVADQGNNLIRRITSAGVVTTLAGSGVPGHLNGTGAAASFNLPGGVATDAAGNVYVTDAGNNLIRKITSGRVVTTLAGSGSAGAVNGTGTAASFNTSYGPSVDASGNLYLVDVTNNLVRKISLDGYTISPVLPAGLSFDGTTGTISGTPTTASPATNYTVTAYNTAGSGISTINIKVTSLPVISYTGPQNYTVNIAISPLSPTNTGGAVPAAIYSQVTTLAGSGTAGNTNGTGTGAAFKNPYGTVADASGNVYVADAGNNLIRKITPAGVVTTFAGSGSFGSVNGTGTAASFSAPRSLAIDGAGNIYVADQGSNTIRKITPAGVVTTFAGSGSVGSTNATGTAASFNIPSGIAADAANNIYVADYGNNLIRMITPGGVVTTFAGSGVAGNTNATGAAASFHSPRNLAADGAGNIYVADQGNNLIRKITPAGVVTTLAGSGAAGHVNGTGTAASFSSPGGVAADASGNVYVSDAGSNLIRKITPGGVVTTFAGSGVAGNTNATGTAASFNSPYGPSIDASGNMYLAEVTNNLVRKISLDGYTISPALPAGLTFDGTTGTITGTPTALSPVTVYTVTAYNASGSAATTVSIKVNGPPVISYASPQTYTANTAISPLSPTNTGGAVPAAIYSQVTTLAGSGTAGNTNGTGTGAAFKSPYGTVTDASGNVYVADAGNNVIRKITPGGVVTTFAGSGSYSSVNGTGTAASFSAPRSLAIDNLGNIYVADQGSNQIRKITPGAVVTTFAGSGSAGAVNATGTAASFNIPSGIAVDVLNNVYVADYGNNLVRKITPGGVVTTFAGSGVVGSTNATGTAASFHSPRNLASDGAGNIYVADQGNNLIRKITSAGVVTTLAGSGAAGHVNGTGTAASFNLPGGVAADVVGNIYVSDAGSNLIRKITPGGVVTTLAGSGVAGNTNATGASASFNAPYGPSVDASGNLYLAEFTNNLVRKISINGYTISPALPAGLIFDGTTGTISGTPTAASLASNYIVTAYNVAGSDTANVNIQVNPQSMALVINPNILVILGEPVVRQAVSPNGDGINDVLTIDNIQSYPQNKVTLANSNGIEIYRMSGYDNVNRAFDGHSNLTGALQKPGTYFYQLEYNINGEIKRKTGFFVLRY